MPELPDVIGGELGTNEWANDIRDRTVQRYPTTAERTADHPTPTAGDLSYLQDSGAVEVFHGGGWRGFLPAGVVLPYAGGAAPSGFLVCNGSAVSRTTYAALYAAIGNAYGAGDGTTTFNLPDMRQRFLMGVAASGTGNSLGATGGAIDHAHTNPTTNNDGSHAHDQGNSATDGGGGAVGNTNLAHDHTVSGTAAHAHTFSDTTGGGSGSTSVEGPGGFSTATAGHTHATSGTTSTAGSGSGTSGTALGNHSHVMPNHAHDLGTSGNAGTHGHTQTPTGTANPPYVTVNYIIRT